MFITIILKCYELSICSLLESSDMANGINQNHVEISSPVQEDQVFTTTAFCYNKCGYCIL